LQSPSKVSWDGCRIYDLCAGLPPVSPVGEAKLAGPKALRGPPLVRLKCTPICHGQWRAVVALNVCKWLRAIAPGVADAADAKR
jgi:hypothetical protein